MNTCKRCQNVRQIHKKEKMNMFRRWKRYFRFGVQYFLYEKPKGLDFTMRDLSLLKSSRGLYHGYSKTEERHLKEIFGNLSFTGEERLLDIGCGKGVVLLEASAYPFQKVAGIDIDERLVTVARKNFQILKMEERVECIQANAAEFEMYGEYNVFFLFNPFAAPVMEKVVDKLIAVSREKRITVIYHNPVYIELFRKEKTLKETHWLYDKVKDYNTCIFQLG